MIGILLKDKEYNLLIEKLTELQVKEMIEQKWYKTEKEEIDLKIKARIKQLKALNN